MYLNWLHYLSLTFRCFQKVHPSIFFLLLLCSLLWRATSSNFKICIWRQHTKMTQFNLVFLSALYLNFISHSRSQGPHNSTLYPLINEGSLQPVVRSWLCLRMHRAVCGYQKEMVSRIGIGLLTLYDSSVVILGKLSTKKISHVIIIPLSAVSIMLCWLIRAMSCFRGSIQTQDSVTRLS